MSRLVQWLAGLRAREIRERRIRLELVCSCGKRREVTPDEEAAHLAHGTLPECCPGVRRVLVGTTTRRDTNARAS